MKVVWDETKNTANQKKHGVSFQEAEELFWSEDARLDIFDEQHSDEEPVSFRSAQSGVGWYWLSGPSEIASRFASSVRDGRRDVSRNSTVSTGEILYD